MEANIKSEQEHIRMREKSMNKDSSSSLTDSEDDDKKKRAATSSSTKKVAGTTSSSKSCQAERCTADLSGARTYHRRHKVCELHAKAPAVLVAGLRQRFCQQCSRFHELLEFDDSKRSCRRRLAGHNERRRKNSGEINNSSSQAAEGSRNLPFNVQENANYNNHFNVTR